MVIALLLAALGAGLLSRSVWVPGWQLLVLGLLVFPGHRV